MSGANDTYARLYHKFAYEFPAIYGNDRLLAAWVRLLMVADASWPMRPPIPRSVPVRAWNTLVDCGLVLPDGDTYTIRGLDAERTRRRDAGRTGAAKRWENERNADRNANASAVAMPNRTEKSNTPLPPTGGGRRADATNPRAISAQMTAANERRERERVDRRKARQRAYLDGRLTEAQRDEMNDRDADLSEIPNGRGAAYAPVPA